MTDNQPSNQTPAEYVIDQFGNNQLARLLNVSPSTVSYWKTRRKKGMNGSTRIGNIPSEYHRRILDLAREHGKPIRPDHLILGQQVPHD